MRALPLSLLALPLTACDADPNVVCPGITIPSIRIVVVDGATGEPVAEGAVGVARDGAYVDSLYEDGYPVATALVGAFGRGGVYDLAVEQAGYEPWRRSGVVARSDGRSCPQVTAGRIEARLERSSP